jgi:hypothetical protein
MTRHVFLWFIGELRTFLNCPANTCKTSPQKKATEPTARGLIPLLQMLACFPQS